MSGHAEKLLLRRQALIAKSQAERMLLVLQGRQLKASLSFAEMGVQVAEKLVKRPAIAAALVAAILILKPRRILPFLGKALSVWQIWQRMAQALRKIQAASAPATHK